MNEQSNDWMKQPEQKTLNISWPALLLEIRQRNALQICRAVFENDVFHFSFSAFPENK